MKSVFLDANILFSAAKSKGVIHNYLISWREKAQFITSEQTYNEVERNLLKKYPDSIKNLAIVMQHVTLVADAENTDAFLMIAQKDRHVMAAAVKARADYLVTGDVKDFGLLFRQII